MSNLQDFYQNFMISSFGKIEMTKLAQLTGNSHDIFTKNLLLNNDFDDDKKLWETIKPFLRNYENKNSGCIVIDDMLMHKPWTKTNDIVCWHYTHKVCLMTLVISFPLFLYLKNRSKVF